jgi:hypothetical protein
MSSFPKKDVLREGPTAELLRSQELENAYLEAASECDDAWETAISDGLSDEEW